MNLDADEMHNPAEVGSLGARINKLFDVMHRANQAPPSNAAVASAITEQTGVPISGTYIWQMRTGRATNPGVKHLRAIAEYFGISASYLLDSETDPNIEAQLDLLQALRDAGIRDLATRAAGLTPGAIESLRGMADHARKLEKLPPVAYPDEGGT